MRRSALGHLACLILFAIPLAGLAQDIAITLDDLPYVMPSRISPEQGLADVTRINTALETHGITATGFVIGDKVGNDTRPALQAFVDAGHTLGNHSWSHPDYDTISARKFRRETWRTDKVISEWLDDTDTRYYRFPYLKIGATLKARQKAAAILSKLGYQNVPVTIDNSDWKFNKDYIDALADGNNAAAEEIAHRYLAHMKERTSHFQALARDALGRDVKHILLLHMNRLNADHLHDLLDLYASEGWNFITVEDALADPIYSAPNLYDGDRGVSQIEHVIGHISD